uniref:Pectinesterase inhibitor domain-containing protein n=1 Tax=Kalanchoe fedtschenkoi TaxID=63787 RepID=A0A7N0U177_KALFE
MARLSFFSFLVLLLTVLHMSCAANSAAATTRRARAPSATPFIRASCRVTRYPAVCVQSLSPFGSRIGQSKRQLTQISLLVSLSKARGAAVFVSRMTRLRGLSPREHGALVDCVENMGDTVDRLSQSVQELGHTGRIMSQEFLWHMSNVQTWVSAALTDETTCVDGFGTPGMEGNVKAAIKRRIVQVAQVTSNTLALVNRFASRH